MKRYQSQKDRNNYPLYYLFQKRAVRLQQQKQKEDLERAARKDRESEKERMLTAKIAKKDAK